MFNHAGFRGHVHRTWTRRKKILLKLFLTALNLMSQSHNLQMLQKKIDFEMTNLGVTDVTLDHCIYEALYN